jgi:FlaA1/EpsC-like NDP-sugar epimerase
MSALSSREGLPIIERLQRVVLAHRRLVATWVYVGVTVVAYWGAFYLRFDLSWPNDQTRAFLSTLPLLIAVRVGCSYGFRLGLGRWRFVSARDVIRLGLAVASGSALFFALTWNLPILPRVPRSVILLEWLLSGYLTASIWLAYRLTFERLRRRGRGTVKRVLLVGAGEAGQMLAHEMLRSPIGYRPVAFVDDDPLKWGTMMHGVVVAGSTREITRFARSLEPDEIVIAIPSARPDQLRGIVERCEETSISFKILPGIQEVLAGDARLHQLREVRLEDLLGREPIQLQLPELAEELAGRTILITGAAGSIGAELARQVALHRPGKLVLVDTAETPLYFIDLELRDRHPDLRVVPLIVDVSDRAMVRRVFQSFRPHRVFHAAAYKHVPLMETHARQAVRTNVLGTWQVADAAGCYGAESFVLVSTDKAVQPVNVMGATKRLAELLVLHLKDSYQSTRYGAVRFGNVLGSSGSVIPLFRWQMENGRPLTVTHEEVSRYFMTIPEAVQLILQASLLTDLTGRVAMLEMGSPVRIVDLARDLLRLSGRPFRLGETVVFTGLRPGEKLHEELVAPGEWVTGTDVPKVKLLGHADDGLESAAVLSLFDALVEDDLDLAVRRFHACFPFLGLAYGGGAPATAAADASGPVVVAG